MTEKLCEMPLHTLLDRLAASTPAPGGGSAAALAGSIGAALIEMVAGLSLTRAEEGNKAELEGIRAEAKELRQDLCSLIDHDSLAYLGVVAAYKLPKDQEGRKQQIQDAIWDATSTPLETLEACRKAEALADRLQPIGLASAASDVAVARAMLAAGVAGAQENVLINVGSLKDEERKHQAEARLKAMGR